MERYRIATICSTSVLAVGLAIMCHESAHVVAGWLAGGLPTLMTATEVRGDFGSLSPAGLVALGVSGSLVNVIFSALGWWVLRRKSGTAERQLGAWFFFAVNGMLVTTKMMAEPLAGFGDWMTILRPLPATTYLRILVALLGTGGVAFMVRRSGAALAMIVPSGEPTHRKAEARRVVIVGAIASTVLVLGSSVAGPVGTTRGILLALGAGLSPFVPMILGVRFVSRIPSRNTGTLATGGWPWFLAASITVIVMWFIFGPGITLSRFLS